jgi:bifunctional DNase/RNase
MGAPIVGDDSVLEAVGIAIPDEEDDEVERFREFLDTISADDFAGSEGEPGPEAP